MAVGSHPTYRATGSFNSSSSGYPLLEEVGADSHRDVNAGNVVKLNICSGESEKESTFMRSRS